MYVNLSSANSIIIIVTDFHFCHGIIIVIINFACVIQCHAYMYMCMFIYVPLI